MYSLTCRAVHAGFSTATVPVTGFPAGGPVATSGGDTAAVSTPTQPSSATAADSIGTDILAAEVQKGGSAMSRVVSAATGRRGALLIAACTLLLACLPAATAHAGVLDARRSYVLGQMIEERAGAGLVPLVASATLTASANQYARVLADLDDISHYVGGTTPSGRAGAAGWPADAQGVGEIISPGDAAELTNDWDPPHRDIMMDPFAVVAGVGVADNLWVIDFATSCPAGREAECQLTGEYGNTDMDIYRVEAEAENDPFTWRQLCPKMRDPKPAQCKKDNSAASGAQNTARTTAALRLSTKRTGRHVTITVSYRTAAVLNAPWVTLRATGQRAKVARRAGRATVSGSRTTVKYRASVRPGRWSVTARTEASPGHRDATATRKVVVR